MSRLACVAWLALGCSEYRIEGIPLPQPSDDDPVVTDDTDDTDVSETGDLRCPDRIWGAGVVSVTESCLIEPPVGTFEPVVEWTAFEYAEFPNHTRTYMTPLVGQMTDDNSDGLVNGLDTPDILVIQFKSDKDGVMRLLSGDGSGVHCTVSE